MKKLGISFRGKCISVLFIPIILLLYNARVFSPFSSKIIIDNSSQKMQDPMLFMAITVKKSNRADRMFDLWGNSYQKWQLSPDQRVFLISSDGAPYGGNPCLGLPKHYQELRDSFFNGTDGSHFDRCIKRIYSLEYFVHNTTADFLALVTDDVVVSLRNLKAYIEELYTFGDPKRVPMVFGHCIDVDWVYLQGGSGYLVSRKAAEIMIQYGYEHIHALFEADDIYITKLFLKAGISPRAMSSDRFVGHHFWGVGSDKLVEHHWDLLPECPTSFVAHYCNVGPFRVNRLVFFHQFYQDMSINLARAIDNGEIPDNIYWYQKESDSILCKKSQ